MHETSQAVDAPDSGSHQQQYLGTLVVTLTDGLPITVTHFDDHPTAGAYVEFVVDGAHLAVRLRGNRTYGYLGHEDDGDALGVVPVRLPRPTQWGYLPHLSPVHVNAVLRRITRHLHHLATTDPDLLITLLDWLSPPPWQTGGPDYGSPVA